MLALGRRERVAGEGGKSNFQSAQTREKKRFNPTSATKWSPPPLPLDEGTRHEGDTAAGEP